MEQSATICPVTPQPFSFTRLHVREPCTGDVLWLLLPLSGSSEVRGGPVVSVCPRTQDVIRMLRFQPTFSKYMSLIAPPDDKHHQGGEGSAKLLVPKQTPAAHPVLACRAALLSVFYCVRPWKLAAQSRRRSTSCTKK